MACRACAAHSGRPRPQERGLRVDGNGAAACDPHMSIRTRTSCLNQGMPYLHCRILTAIDVDCLLGAGLCYDDLGVVNMVSTIHLLSGSHTVLPGFAALAAAHAEPPRLLAYMQAFSRKGNCIVARNYAESLSHLVEGQDILQLPDILDLNLDEVFTAPSHNIVAICNVAIASGPNEQSCERQTCTRRDHSAFLCPVLRLFVVCDLCKPFVTVSPYSSLPNIRGLALT